MLPRSPASKRIARVIWRISACSVDAAFVDDFSAVLSWEVSPPMRIVSPLYSAIRRHLLECVYVGLRGLSHVIPDGIVLVRRGLHVPCGTRVRHRGYISSRESQVQHRQLCSAVREACASFSLASRAALRVLRWPG